VLLLLLILLELQNKNGNQEILIKKNREEVYHYKPKNGAKLWQGVSY
jgi:hypothetical protein